MVMGQYNRNKSRIEIERKATFSREYGLLELELEINL